jgi:G:T-mismatch repair DNA endonuclease (very short patch repair protein)
MANKKKKMGKIFKKTSECSGLEVEFANILTELGIKFKQHFMFKKREFDFLLLDHNILVETHGCFFHCCKQHNPEVKYPFQKKNLKNDQYKVKIVKFNKNYNLLVVWEHEIKNKKLLTERIDSFIEKYSVLKILNG